MIDQLNRSIIMRESSNMQKVETQKTLEQINSLYQSYFSRREFSSNDCPDQIPITNREDRQNSFTQQQVQQESKSIKRDQTAAYLNEMQNVQQQNNSIVQKHFQDQNFMKSQENILQSNYPKGQEMKYLNQNKIQDKYNEEFQQQTISSPNVIPINPIEITDMFLSPQLISQDRQHILVSQSYEQQSNFMLQPSKLIQQHNNHYQEMSLNNISSYQNLKIGQLSRKNIQFDQCNALKLISCIENPFQDEVVSIENQQVKREKIKNNKEKEDLKQEQKNEIASINSSKYSTEEMIKKKMIQRIKKKEFSKGLKLMALSGVAAFIILSAVSLIIYIENLKSLDSFIESFLKIDSAQYCFIDVVSLVGLNNYKLVIGFGQAFIFDTIDLQQYETYQLNYQQIAVLKDYNSNLQKLVLNNDSGDQLDELQNKLFEINIYQNGFYNQARIQKNSTKTFKQSLQYTLMEYLYQITFYYIGYEDSLESYIWGNIYSFKQRMKGLQIIVENYAKEQFNNMNLQQISTIVLFTTICIILVFSILPLNVIIQFQKEKVMKLFGTFSPSSIEFQIKQIELGIYKLEQMNILDQTGNSNNAKKRSLNQKKQTLIRDLNFYANCHNEEAQKYEYRINSQIPRYIQRQLDKRNRKIASFSNLPKFNLILFFLCFVSVALLLVMPILNLVKFNPFETESQVTLQDRTSIIDIYSLIMENFCTHMEQIFMLFIESPTSTSYYQTYLDQIQSQNSQVFKYLQDLTLNLQVQRKNEELFMDFYQNLINQNICQVRVKYPQYFNSNITEVQCNQLFNGILQRGLIFSVQQVFSTFHELYQIYQTEDLTELKNKFIQFQASYSFIQFKQLVQIISEVVNSFRFYQNDQMQQNKEQLKQNLLCLLIIQFIIFCIVFMIGWAYLFYWFRSQLRSATKIFTLFHINLLYENDFIQQYLRRIQVKK